MHFVKQLGRDIKESLEAGKLQRFGELMNTHWEYKKGRSKSMSNERIDHWYQLATEERGPGREADRRRRRRVPDVPLPGGLAGAAR